MVGRAQCFFIAAAVLAGCGSPIAPVNVADIGIDIGPDVLLADTLDPTASGDAAETASDGDIQSDGAAVDGAEAGAGTDALTPDDTPADSAPDGVDVQADASDVSADLPPELDTGASNSDAIDVAQATDTQDTDGGPFDSGDALVATCQCGDGICSASCGETEATCPADCKGCGNGVCEPGEGPKSCAIDCCGSCGDGKCKGYDCGESPQACPQDCANACGNKVCDKGESPATCAEDCVWQVCGNGVCEGSDGGPAQCPQDCDASCGDGVCNKGEDFLGCPVDCGYCGDGFCVAGLAETTLTCPADCDKNPDCDPAIPGDVTKCDDGNPCTIEQCNPVGHCKHLPTGGVCDDGNVCTVSDSCVNAVCTPGATTSCDDENPCTAESCNATLGCKHKPTTAACDDGNQCTVGDTCGLGACFGGSFLDCDDGNVCTADACDPAEGCTSVTADGVKCTDGNPCTVADACAGGVCVSGEPLGCNDGNPCTDDSCSTKTGCVHLPSAGTCSDDNACTVGDSCLNTVCTSGAAAICNDNKLCTDDACSSKLGCTFSANTTACDDANACTVGDTCLEGVCASGAVQSCEDGNQCTIDSCDAALGCGHQSSTAACDDGNKCTVGEVCKSGSCSGGAALACDDGNDCTTDACVPTTGCIVTPADGGACSDGSACTIGDLCAGSACVASGPLGCDDSNPCSDDSCDPKSGCVHLASAATCSDGNVCTVGDACLNAVCTPGAATVCDDANPCTTDTCNSKTGCVFADNAVVCSDGNACTIGDVCAAGVCQTGNVQANCDDGKQCTVDTCDTKTGCQYTAAALSCSDGNPCTEGDTCTGETCAPGTPVTCDDANVCTADTCDTKKGCQHTAVAGGCDDGTSCTYADFCANGSCTGKPKIGVTIWGGSGTEAAYDVAAVDDGGFVIAATKPSPTGKGQAVDVTRYAATGVKAWTAVIDSAYDDVPISVLATPGAAQVVVAINVSDNLGDSIGTRMVALDSTGTTLWDKSYNAGGWYYFDGVAAIASGGYLAADSSSGLPNVLRVGADGTSLWSVKLALAGDTIMAIAAASDGSSLVAGTGNLSDVWAAIVNPTGSKVTYVNLAATQLVDISTACAIPSGGYFLLGTCDSVGYYGWLLVQVDAVGKVISTQRLDSAAGDPLSIRVADSGGVLLSGANASGTDSIAWLGHFDDNANVAWQQTEFQLGSSALVAVEPLLDGGVIAVGYRGVQWGASDVLIVRTDRWGNLSCPASGGCFDAAPITCDDANPCTADSCTATDGCTHTPLASGAACGAAKTCSGTTCS